MGNNIGRPMKTIDKLLKIEIGTKIEKEWTDFLKKK